MDFLSKLLLKNFDFNKNVKNQIVVLNSSIKINVTAYGLHRDHPPSWRSNLSQLKKYFISKIS